MQPLNSVITGGSGFIGRSLTKRLRQHHQLTVWDRCQLADPAFPREMEVKAVIHLAGEPVAQRWNFEVRRRIRDSRVAGTRKLVDAISRAELKPEVLVCASAIGIYGDRGDEILTETSAPGTGFLSDVCVEWEAESSRAAEFGVRVVQLRIGFVLGKGGGALARMVPAFRWFAGGRLGSGQQWMPWIHLDDVIEMIVRSVEDLSVSGVWNAVSPHSVRNAEFTQELARAVRRPALLPVPAFALRLAFGELGGHMLDSARVVPSAAEAHGFSFRYPELRAALRDLT